MSKARDIADSTTTLDVDGGTIKLDGNYPVGTGNVALGDTALDSNVSGASNTAIGADALTANTASNNTAVGYQAAYSNTTGSTNTAVGSFSLLNSTVANGNSAFGYASGRDNTTGGNLSAFGYFALESNTTGSNNVAVGTEALTSNTTASNNTAVGYQAAYSNTTGAANVYVGYQAGYAANYAGNGLNTFVGMQSGYSVTSGRVNTLIGYGAGGSITTGSNNTILGSYNGNQDGLDIRASNNNIVLSDGDGNPRVRVDSSGTAHFGQAGAAGDGIYVHADTDKLAIQSKRNNDGDHIRFYNSSSSIAGNIGVSGSSTYYNTSSDHRLKENVVELTGATDRLKQLNPSRFNFIADADTTVDGFLAHEVQAVVPEAVTGTKDAVDADGNPEYQGIDQSKLVPLLVATIQELEARITALEAN